jgi:hypothetical protein
MDGRPLKLEFLIHGENEYMRGTNSVFESGPRRKVPEECGHGVLFENKFI